MYGQGYKSWVILWRSNDADVYILLTLKWDCINIIFLINKNAQPWKGGEPNTKIKNKVKQKQTTKQLKQNQAKNKNKAAQEKVPNN